MLANHINFVIAFTSLTVVRVGCLRNVVVSIPHAVKEGDMTILNCTFQLDGDALYTVKWYKGGDEFFRYTPKENPPVKVFPTSGIDSTIIDQKNSDMNSVIFKKVIEPMAGRYTCEVSADAPSFHTAFEYGIMTVVLTPESGPTLTGLHARYRVGEKLTAQCKSNPSKPAANITWYLNDRHVNKSHVDLYLSEEIIGSKYLQSSMSNIFLHLKHSHFIGGRLKLKCVASINNVYWETTEKSSEQIGHNKLQKPDHSNQVYHPTEEQEETYHRPTVYHKPTEQGFTRNLASSSVFSWRWGALLTLANIYIHL